MTWEVGKEYKTKCGYRARIYATDGDGGVKIHGAINISNKWLIHVWCTDGTSSYVTSIVHDLTPEPWTEPQKRKVWMGYKTNRLYYATEEELSEDIPKGSSVNDAYKHCPELERGE